MGKENMEASKSNSGYPVVRRELRTGINHMIGGMPVDMYFWLYYVLFSNERCMFMLF